MRPRGKFQVQGGNVVTRTVILTLNWFHDHLFNRKCPLNKFSFQALLLLLLFWGLNVIEGRAVGIFLSLFTFLLFAAGACFCNVA